MSQAGNNVRKIHEVDVDPAVVRETRADASGNPTHIESASTLARQEPSLTFDPELDLGDIRTEDDLEENPQKKATANKRGSGLSRMLRTVLSLFGVLLILLVALVMYIRASKDPSSEPPVTARVPVLESALAGRVERNDELQTAIQAESREVPSAPQEQPVQPRVAVPVAPEVAASDVVPQPESIMLANTVMSVITEMQQVLGEHRDLIHDLLAQNKQFQAELQDIRTSSEATSLRVDSLAADLAQVRHSLEDLTARETKKVATLQRQLSVKNAQARQQALQVEAQRNEPPPFRVASVTLWGSDYLATVTLSSGSQRDVTVGELLDGWKINAISATGVSVTRLHDGIKMNLAPGV